MFKRIGLAVFAAAGVCFQAMAGSPETTKQQFDAVASQLDQGGDLYVVMNIDGMVDGALAFFQKLAESQAENDEGAAQAQAVIARLRAFLDENGLNAAHAAGMSASPQPDGMTAVKMFVSRDPKAADLPLWRGLFGGKPRKLESLGFVPADAVIVGARTLNPAELWKMIRSGIDKVAPAEAAAEFNKGLADFVQKSMINPDKIFPSIGEEMLISVQLSRTNNIAIPGPSRNMVRIPEPSFLAVVALKDKTLPAIIEEQLMKTQTPVIEQESDDVVVRSISMPNQGAPFTFQPTYAICDGYMVAGSSAATVMEAVRTHKKGGGFASSAEYNRNFAGMPAENNGLTYVSPRYSQMIMKMMEGGMRSDEQKVAMSLMEVFMGGSNGLTEAFVIMNQKNGVLVRGTVSVSGKKMTAGIFAWPVMMMAGTAIPAFQRSRSAATEAACMNNLRMIDQSKEMWAIDNDKQKGDAVTEEDIKNYLGGAAMPKCPLHGAYTLGAIGDRPTCSHASARKTRRAPPAMPQPEEE